MSKPVRIRLASEAERDLQRIYNQRLSQRGAIGPDGADALLDRLFAAMEGLTEFPHRGLVPAELEILGIVSWRQISVVPYRIIYSLADDVIMIAVIADGRRDFAWLLERRLLS